MTRPFQLDLEYVRSTPAKSVIEAGFLTFRLTFSESAFSLLLSYPEEIGLRFMTPEGELLSEWRTGVLVSGMPRYEFVLRPRDRISFDFNAAINVPSDHYRRWTIQVPQGETRVEYAYQKEVDWDRYVALAERSRAAQIAKPFGGRVVSNSVQVFIE
jgi:hypothetical protein